jgi:hypothetical protein
MKRAGHFLGALATLLAVPSALAQLLVATESAEVSEYYPWIATLSRGPVAWVEFDEGVDEEGLPSEVVRGQFFRIAVTTAEETSSYFLERITIGAEGCCMQLASTVRLETFRLADQLGLPINVSFAPVRWVSPTSYIFEAQSRKFEMRGLDSPRPTVAEIKD